MEERRVLRSAKRTIASTKEPILKNKKGKTAAKIMNCSETDDIESLVPLWEPPKWRQVYENILAMRKSIPAPVDTMGCDQCHDNSANVTKEDQRFQILVSLMLSAQTKDEITFATMSKLKARGLSVDTITKMPEGELGQLIQSVGFWKTKAKHIKMAAEMIKREYEGDIPGTLDGLMRLPGVGPKMAHLAMQCAWNKVTGIAVDVHVHRISNRLGWVKKPGTKEPEETRKQLESWVPKEHWKDINHALVGFGQTICSAKKPKCDECLNKDLCPFAAKGTMLSSKKPKTN